MTSISSNYSNLASYGGTSMSSLLSDTSSTAADNDDSGAGVSNGTDTVTVSTQALEAANRESLGLPVTGALTLSDFETASSKQEETVSSLLSQAMEELGIGADQQVSLSLGSDNGIKVTNSFTGSQELEEALNSSSEFTQAFTALTANNEILDFTEYLQEKVRNTSLADYINNDTTQTDLLTLAAEYAGINAASSSLETLCSISHAQTSYTYEYI